ncbi:hypothetical protein ACFV4N_32225 [Actinosynnema sp. NPDC059797]
MLAPPSRATRSRKRCSDSTSAPVNSAGADRASANAPGLAPSRIHAIFCSSGKPSYRQ